MKYNIDPNELTKEKSLWDIYTLSRRIRSNRFNVKFVVGTAMLLLAHAYILQDNDDILLADVRGLATLTLNCSLTVLGFLIAGFTVFATLSKPAMLLKMMEVPHENGLPYLKYNFIAFIQVFIYYFVAALFCLIIILFGAKGGLVSKIVALLPCSASLRSDAIRISYILVGVTAVYLLLILKTFIFNIYSIIMNSLRWELKNANDS
jgi:uncharacterized membrane protein YuzA (DUF378 family)